MHPYSKQSNNSLEHANNARITRQIWLLPLSFMKAMEALYIICGETVLTSFLGICHLLL